MLKTSKIKKYLSSVLAVAILVCGSAIGTVADAASDVAIDKTHFKDDVWRGIVSTYLDYDHNGSLSSQEIAATTLMDVSGFLEAEYGDDTPVEISDLSGIEYFTALKTLRIGGIGVETVNLSSLVQLESLTCQGNYLESLSLINNDALTEVNCSANFIEWILFSPETNLKKLICHTNELTTINLSQHTQLETLSIFQNKLTALDLSHNPLLSTLNCANNRLKTLDLSSNPLLADIIENAISNQQVTATANYSAEDGSIYADFALPNASRIVSTSLDWIEIVDGSPVPVKGYDGSSFITFEPEAILGGVDYYYDVNLDGAEPMKVHVNISRDFYVVRYYDSKTLENKIGEEIVNGGNAAVFGSPEEPTCKSFIRWNDDLSFIIDDVQTYAIWQENHNLHRSFSNGVASVTCSRCGLNEDYVFSETINARTDDENYVSYLDVNSDGIINAKDFAGLLKGM